MSVPDEPYSRPRNALFDNSGAVIAFGVLAGVLLVAGALCGLRLACAIFLFLIGFAGLSLVVLNRTQVVDARMAGRRITLTVSVALLVLIQIGGGIALWRADPSIHVLAHAKKIWLARLIILSLATSAASVELSSLVDWCYTGPRLRGVYGDRPCRTSAQGQWKSVTRLWLLHRVTAYIAVRAGLLVALAAPASLLVPRFTQSDKTIAAAVVAAIAGFFISRITPLAIFAFSPSLQVGDRVVLAEEFGTGVETRPTYYVVDIEVSGVNLMQLGAGDMPIGSGQNRTHDRRVGLADIERLLRMRDRFSGCDVRCSRTNKYCPYRSGVLVEDQLKPKGARRHVAAAPVGEELSDP